MKVAREKLISRSQVVFRFGLSRPRRPPPLSVQLRYTHAPRKEEKKSTYIPLHTHTRAGEKKKAGKVVDQGGKKGRACDGKKEMEKSEKWGRTSARSGYVARGG